MPSAGLSSIVPILAPKITEIACGRLISPAHYKADDHNGSCQNSSVTQHVTRAPASAPMIGFFVRNSRIFFIFSPAAFCSASLHTVHSIKEQCQPTNQPKYNFYIFIHFVFSLFRQLSAARFLKIICKISVMNQYNSFTVLQYSGRIAYGSIMVLYDFR